MISLTPRQRSLVLFLSASSYIAWFAGLGERLDAQGIARSPLPTMTLAPHVAMQRLDKVIRRDPFSGAPPPRDDTSVDKTSTIGSAQDEREALGPSAPGIVSNSNGGVPDIIEAPQVADLPRRGDDSASLVLRATITGANPVAYVANGTMMDIVRTGDRLGDRRIVKIDLRGLTFSDGSRLDLPGPFEATPAPRTGTKTITIGLEDLRKLVLGTRAGAPLAPPATASSNANTTSPPSPSATFPTPGPLPTVDQRGVPVGTNPTFDPTAPTPYPEAYPYAPPPRRP